MTLRILSIYFFSTGNLCLGAGAKCHGSSCHKERMLPEFFCWNIYTFCHSLWSLRSSHWVLLVPTSDPLNISDPSEGGQKLSSAFPELHRTVKPLSGPNSVLDRSWIKGLHSFCTICLEGRLKFIPRDSSFTLGYSYWVSLNLHRVLTSRWGRCDDSLSNSYLEIIPTKSLLTWTSGS